MPDTIWFDLAVVGLLVWLGYLGARFAGRFKLPAVTGFLVMGVLLGPYGAGLLSIELLETLSPVQQLALGLIVFLIGEELTGRMLRRHHWSFWVVAVGGAVLPAALVAAAAVALFPDQPLYAWLLGAIAVSGAPATLMAVMAECRVSGRTSSTLLGANAFHDIATVVAYSVVVPFLLWRLDIHASIGAAALETGRELGGALALGLAFGWILAGLLSRASEQGELLALGLTHVLLIVAAAEAAGVSALLAPLVMGVTVAVLEERRGTRDRCFRALRTVEYPVYIIFFTLAGAELQVTAVLTGGFLALAYIAARSAGKVAAGAAGGLLSGMRPSDSLLFGLGLLPQAGVAVGLALSISQTFPEVGATVNAVILASIIFFEAVGPLAARKALLRFGEPAAEGGETAEGAACPTRQVIVPVSATMGADRVLEVMRAADTPDECPTTFILAHVVTAARPYTTAESVQRGEELVASLAERARAEGYQVATWVVQARGVEEALATLAREVEAQLVAVSARPLRAGLVRSPLRRRVHRVLDAAGVPTLVVPVGSVPEPPPVAAEEEAAPPAPPGAETEADLEREPTAAEGDGEEARTE